MNSAQKLITFLNDNLNQFGFSINHYKATLENPHNVPCISSYYISVWPVIPTTNITELQRAFRQIDTFVHKSKSIHAREDDEFLYFALLEITDTVGTSIITISDDEVLQELRLKINPHETSIGTCKVVPLCRFVKVTLYPSEKVARMDPDTPGFWNTEKIEKRLLNTGSTS